MISLTRDGKEGRDRWPARHPFSAVRRLLHRIGPIIRTLSPAISYRAMGSPPPPLLPGADFAPQTGENRSAVQKCVGSTLALEHPRGFCTDDFPPASVTAFLFPFLCAPGDLDILRHVSKGSFRGLFGFGVLTLEGRGICWLQRGAVTG